MAYNAEVSDLVTSATGTLVGWAFFSTTFMLLVTTPNTRRWGDTGECGVNGIDI